MLVKLRSNLWTPAGFDWYVGTLNQCHSVFEGRLWLVGQYNLSSTGMTTAMTTSIRCCLLLQHYGRSATTRKGLGLASKQQWHAASSFGLTQRTGCCNHDDASLLNMACIVALQSDYILDVLSGLPDAVRGTNGAAVALSLPLEVRCRSEDSVDAFCATADVPLAVLTGAAPAGLGMTLLGCARKTDASTVCLSDRDLSACPDCCFACCGLACTACLWRSCPGLGEALCWRCRLPWDTTPF